MSMQSLKERIEAVLVNPLSEVTRSREQVFPSSSVVRGWDIPEGDRSALISWGLPADSEMRPDIQTEPYPVLAPSVAGDPELQLMRPDQRLYRLASWGAGVSCWIGAVAGTGQVMTISSEPLKGDDLHPQLRSHNPDFYEPAVRVLNSTVMKYVEISWRWRAVENILFEVKSPNPMSFTNMEAARAAFNAHVDLVESCENIVFERVGVIDDRVRADGRYSPWWREFHERFSSCL